MTAPRKPPPPPPGAPARRHPRFELIAQVELRRGEEVVVLPVGNISAGGVFVKLERGASLGLSSGDAVSVFVAAEEGDEDLAFGMDAVVVHVDGGGGDRPAGVGLMWTSTDAAPVAILSRLLGRLAER
jgi:hypothetical protein